VHGQTTLKQAYVFVGFVCCPKFLKIQNSKHNISETGFCVHRYVGGKPSAQLCSLYRAVA
jgi:hypothetical protein